MSRATRQDGGEVSWMLLQEARRSRGQAAASTRWSASSIAEPSLSVDSCTSAVICIAVSSARSRLHR